MDSKIQLKIRKKIEIDPHLTTNNFNKGKLKLSEHYHLMYRGLGKEIKGIYFSPVSVLYETGI